MKISDINIITESQDETGYSIYLNMGYPNSSTNLTINIDSRHITEFMNADNDSSWFMEKTGGAIMDRAKSVDKDLNEVIWKQFAKPIEKQSRGHGTQAQTQIEELTSSYLTMIQSILLQHKNILDQKSMASMEAASKFIEQAKATQNAAE